MIIKTTAELLGHIRKKVRIAPQPMPTPTTPTLIISIDPAMPRHPRDIRSGLWNTSQQGQVELIIKLTSSGRSQVKTKEHFLTNYNNKTDKNIPKLNDSNII